MNRPTPNASGEIYARSPISIANGTFTRDGRLVVTQHPTYETPRRASIFTGPATLEPFPNEAWNTPRKDSDDWLDAPQGLRTDSQGHVWLLDMGTRSHIAPKFVVWDTQANALVRLLRLPSSVLTPYFGPNDFVLDERHGAAYIADEGAENGGDGSRAALIVVDLKTGRARRRLEGKPGIPAEDRPIMFGDKELMHKGENGRKNTPFRSGVDGIAIDHANEWVYYGPLNGNTIWRLRTKDLLDDSLDDDALQRRAERYAERPNTGGMWMDAAGNLYMTEVAGNSIGRIAPNDRTYRRVLTREDMYWPDDVIPGPDGALYVVVSQLAAAPKLVGGRREPELPFLVIRFWPDGRPVR